MIYTLAIEIKGQQHNIAVFHDQSGEGPDVSEKEVEALYQEYCRVGRTLNDLEARWIIEAVHVLH